MRKKNLASLARRLHDGQADFERRHSPRARMTNGPVENDGVVEFFEFRASRRAPFKQGNIFNPFVAVHVKPVLGLADVASLARNDEDAEVIGDPRSALSLAAKELPFLRAADAHGVFVLVLVSGSVE